MALGKGKKTQLVALAWNCRRRARNREMKERKSWTGKKEKPSPFIPYHGSAVRAAKPQQGQMTAKRDKIKHMKRKTVTL